MRLDAADIAELQLLIAPTVHAVMEEVRANEAKLPPQLAFDEKEAGPLIGVPWSVLRDCRYRGEIVGSRVGVRIVYERGELLRFLAAQRETGGRR